MSFIKDLNEKQLEAVQITEGYLRVIAGAGSGKTKLLVSRYAYLVKECGINSANILCITFTNKAAGEMKRRIRALIGDGYDTSLICTYHGFCARVLRDDIDKLFYPKSFQIIDTSQQKAILAEIYEELELKLDHASFEKILKEIAIYKANSDYVAKMSSTEFETEEDEDINKSIITKYLQRQKQVFALDFHDLINFALYLFETHKDVLKKWQEKLNYIQVDEFQDSAKNELRLIELLSNYYKNLMIVGDPDQTIYEWRGSDVKLLVDFDKMFVPTKTVFLNQNYRSTPQILKCANELIDRNIFRLKKDLFTQSADGFAVHHYHTKSEYEEADCAVQRIAELKKSGAKYSDTAILYRSGFLSRIIEKKLAENGIPYEIFGGVKFFDRMEIQDIISYLRLIAFDDDVSFKRIINKPRRKFGRIKLQSLIAMQKSGDSLYDTLKMNIESKVFNGSSVGEFIKIFDKIKADSAFLPISNIVNSVCEKTGYEQYIRELGDMERFENLTEFKRIASEYEKGLGEDINLAEFLSQLSLQYDFNDEERDTVKLMTIHAAKGLEFKNVFIIGLSEGIFPSPKTIEERKEMGLEEERRLCYVAITRAMEKLFLLESEGFTNSGKAKFPSRFIAEIGEENLVQIGDIPKNVPIPQQAAPNDKEEKAFEVDDRVTHRIFGDGTVTAVNKKSHSYEIKFDSLPNARSISFEYFEKKPDKKEQNSEQIKNSDFVPVETKTHTSIERKNATAEKKEHEEKPAKPPNFDNKQSTVNLPKSDWITNKWDDPNFPKTDWHCSGVSDMGYPCVQCEMCGKQIVRYVHHMVHISGLTLDTGCICAGKLEGDIERAKRREQELKSNSQKMNTFMNKKWKTSRNGNQYTKHKERLIVLYKLPSRDVWKYSIDGEFCTEIFSTKEEAMAAAFQKLNS